MNADCIELVRIRFVGTLAVLLWPVLVHGQSVTVSSTSELRAAVNDANGSGGNVTIFVEAGTYTLDDGLYISAPEVTIAGKSGNREDVVIQGDAMSASASVGNLITVAAKGFTLDAVTLQRSGNHLIQIRGETNADSPVVRNCILRDAYEQMLKVSVNTSNTSVSSDNGIVENCLFEYTAGIGPQYYIGGIDAHSAKNWIVRNNVFKSIISPNTSIAEYAIHFWNDSGDNLVERNLIINCDRGIGFGLNSRGNTGGIIRNNMIYHADNRGQFADVGIAIHNSPGTAVYNNSIFMEHGYPNSIEYRFSGTSNALIANNLVNATIRRLDGASGTESTNNTGASKAWFVNPDAGDLHLAEAVPSVVDNGEAITGLTDDYDGDQRMQGGPVDIGADEYFAGVRPNAPEDLTVQ
jgi:hypothetical protein